MFPWPIFSLHTSTRVISAKWLPLKWWSHITWRQGRAHCTTWEELSHHRELVPSPPHESSLYSASWYKIIFFLRNYSTCYESPLAVLLELFHDRVSSKGLEEAPGRTRLSWRWKLRLIQSGGMLHLHSFCNENTPLMFDKNLKDTLSVLSLVPREAGAPHTLSDKSLRVNFFIFLGLLLSIFRNITELTFWVFVVGTILKRILLKYSLLEKD